jgi:hypothetical protein
VRRLSSTAIILAFLLAAEPAWAATATIQFTGGGVAQATANVESGANTTPPSSAHLGWVTSTNWTRISGTGSVPVDGDVIDINGYNVYLTGNPTPSLNLSCRGVTVIDTAAAGSKGVLRFFPSGGNAPTLLGWTFGDGTNNVAVEQASGVGDLAFANYNSTITTIAANSTFTCLAIANPAIGAGRASGATMDIYGAINVTGAEKYGYTTTAGTATFQIGVGMNSVGASSGVTVVNVRSGGAINVTPITGQPYNGAIYVGCNAPLATALLHIFSGGTLTLGTNGNTGVWQNGTACELDIDDLGTVICDGTLTTYAGCAVSVGAHHSGSHLSTPGTFTLNGIYNQAGDHLFGLQSGYSSSLLPATSVASWYGAMTVSSTATWHATGNQFWTPIDPRGHGQLPAIDPACTWTGTATSNPFSSVISTSKIVTGNTLLGIAGTQYVPAAGSVFSGVATGVTTGTLRASTIGALSASRGVVPGSINLTAPKLIKGTTVDDVVGTAVPKKIIVEQRRNAK